jgi:DNA-binding XRE family transcriptional regulator
MAGSAQATNKKPDWAARLREARVDHFPNSGEAAEMLNLSASNYRACEAGKYSPLLLVKLAEVFPHEAEGILTSLREDGHLAAADERQLPEVLVTALVEANVTRFHPNRDYYRRERAGSGSISEYVALANQKVEMVSINLATGNDMEMLADTFEELISRRRNSVRVTVSLIDPENEYLSECIARVIRSSPKALRERINDTINALTELRETRLSRARRGYLEVWCHASLPNGSAIIIDGDSEDGRFQLETKGYQLGMHKSFGFEVMNGSEFFRDLRDSYRHLISDGRQIL